MPQTYDYKVRDRTGNVADRAAGRGQRVARPPELREMGMTPVEVKKVQRVACRWRSTSVPGA